MHRLSRIARALSAALADASRTSRSVAAVAPSEAPVATTKTLPLLAAAALLAGVSTAAATTTATAASCEPAPPPSSPPPLHPSAAAVRSAVLSAWEAADADCHRDESALSPLAPIFAGILPPPAAPPSVAVDAQTGVASVSFSLREGADELGVLLALAELLQELSLSSSSSSSHLSGSKGAEAPKVSVAPLQQGGRGGKGGRGLRLSACGADAAAAAATFFSSDAPPPRVELSAPADSLVVVAARGGQQREQQRQQISSSSPLEKLFRASNAVVSSFEEGQEDGEGRKMRRSFSRTWSWHSGGDSSNEERSKDLRVEAAGALLRGVDEVFRQSLEELFGPLEREGEEPRPGGGVRLEGRPASPAAPSPLSPSSPSRPPPLPPRSSPARPPPPVPRGGSARAASAISALEDLGCSVFLPRPLRPTPTPAAETEGGVQQQQAQGEEDPWSGLAAYDHQKEEIRLALLPLTHPEVVSGVAEAARKGVMGDSFAAAPRAVLFEGPPGCGKTSSARAAARLAGVPLVVAPLESIVSKWYGEAEQRLAAVFKHSRELAAASASAASVAAPAAPAASASTSSNSGVLLFIDEVDALATSRGEGGMHEATRRVLGTLLRELDGLRERNGSGSLVESPGEEQLPSTATGNVVAVLSTNRPTDLDAALASRCAARVFFPLPNLDDRAAVLALHARHLTEKQLAELAKGSEALSPRDLADAAAAAERSWASRIVAGKADRDTAPPFVEYKRAVEERVGRRW